LVVISSQSDQAISKLRNAMSTSSKWATIPLHRQVLAKDEVVEPILATQRNERFWSFPLIQFLLNHQQPPLMWIR
jgi:hypothetical protein